MEKKRQMEFSDAVDRVYRKYGNRLDLFHADVMREADERTAAINAALTDADRWARAKRYRQLLPETFLLQIPE